MPALPQLAEPRVYRPCLWNLSEHPQKRAYWLDLFRDHFPSLLQHAREEAADRGAPEPACEEATRRLEAWLEQAERDPSAVPPRGLDILAICDAREAILRQAGIADPYRLAKQEETAQCEALLPELLAELDALPVAEQAEAVVRGVFAGNIFDLGAKATTAMFADGPVDFRQVRADLKPRPWHVDGLDAWLARIEQTVHHEAVMFVDNAGPDVTLGMLPWARWLLKRGTRVILTANAAPSLNDVTHDELVALVERVVAWDPVFADALTQGRLRLIASGNGAPLIDLSNLSEELVAACASADLVVLEGMGRSIESNWHVRFNCDAIKIAMLKEKDVASSLGGQMYDLVMKFEV